MKRSYTFRLYPTERQELALMQMFGSGGEKIPCEQFARVHLAGERLYLSRVGFVKIKVSRALPKDAHPLTIRRQSSGKWHFIYSVTEVRKKGGSKGEVKNLSTCEFQRRKWLLEKKLSRARWELQRKEMGSVNWHKQLKKIAILQERHCNLQRDYWHKETTKAVREGLTLGGELPKIARKMLAYKSA